MTFFKCHYFHQIFNVDSFNVSSLMFIVFWCFIKRHCWLIYIDTLKSIIIDLPMLTLTLAPRNVQNIICLFWHSKKCYLMWIIILKILLLKWYILYVLLYIILAALFFIKYKTITSILITISSKRNWINLGIISW